ncbi:MAG: hypothetical protein RLZZ142_2382 [Verrucomicrobiota bacterium]
MCVPGRRRWPAWERGRCRLGTAGGSRTRERPKGMLRRSGGPLRGSGEGLSFSAWFGSSSGKPHSNRDRFRSMQVHPLLSGHQARDRGISAFAPSGTIRSGRHSWQTPRPLRSGIVGLSHASAANPSSASTFEVIDGSNLQCLPAGFQATLAKIQSELAESGGSAVAGQVQDQNGALPNPGEYAVALKRTIADTQGTYRFEDGWFISGRLATGFRGNSYSLQAFSFNHVPLEAPVKLERGEITWVKVTLAPAPPEKETPIAGVVRSLEGAPMPNAHVSLRIKSSTGEFHALAEQTVTADAEGKFAFSPVTIQTHCVSASREGYEAETLLLEPYGGGRSGDSSAPGELQNPSIPLSEQMPDRLRVVSRCFDEWTNPAGPAITTKEPLDLFLRLPKPPQP